MRRAIQFQLAGLLAATYLSAAEHWLKLTSPHFRMYTTNGQAKAVDVLRIFEEARDFFAAKSPSKPVSEDPVVIVAFHSEKEYAPYRVNKGAFAYFQRAHKCDYIVMQQLGQESVPAAIHEYTHLFVEHLGLELPLWLNEGLADVYSSLQPKGDKLMVGTPPPGRLETLRPLGPINLHVLLNVGRESEYYNKQEAMAQFYAESWELTHMLVLGKKYRAGFSRFLTEIAAGKSAEQAFADVYQKSLDQVESDLQDYLSPHVITVSLFDIHLNEKQIDPQVENPTATEIELVLADLMATHPETAAQGRARLNQLAAQLPNSAEVQESLGYVAWQEHKPEEAREHFEQALKYGAKSAKLLFSYASVLHDMHAPAAQIVPILQQTLELKPYFYDARYDLGMEETRANDCADAIAAFSALKTVTPERAFPLFSTEAYCYWRLENAGEARRAAQLAQRYAKTPEETAQMQNLLDQINRVSPPQ